MKHTIAQLYESIERVLEWTQEEVYDLDPAEVRDLQLHWLQRRFRALRPHIRALDRLAQETEIDAVETLDDVVPLCFPHTMLKAYSIADVENRRFDRLTRWLGTMTAHDLSAVETSGVETLEDWLARVESVAPLQLSVSGGTSGKVSIMPKSHVEGLQMMHGMLRLFLPYCDEPGFDPRSGEAAFITPSAGRTGRSSALRLYANLLGEVFGGREDRLITLGKRHISADDLWLTGKLRRAEARGEELQLTDRERERARLLAEEARKTSSSEQLDAFIERAILGQRGRKIFLISIWQNVYELASACKQRGVRAEFAPGSMFVFGGGAKNWTFPEGWQDLIAEVFPVIQIENYGMSESSAMTRLCKEGHWHIPPWGVSWVLDPKTSRPYPRRGIQTGRHAVFDLLAQSYWAGTLSGDKVTMHWEGGCKCGRKGPYLEKDVRRFTEAEGGDDKISCAKTPDAYQNLMKFALGEIE